MANWIKSAIKHPGALTKTAKASGGFSKKTGKIKVAWLKKQAAKGSTTTARRARLALTLRKFK